MTRIAIAIVAYALGRAASACGVCVDDKIAAVYDHAVVTHAAAARRVVVFAEVRGVASEASMRAIAAAAARTPGVDRASVRSAVAPAALSFALDARARSPQAALDAIGRDAAKLHATLALLRVVDGRVKR